MRLQADCRQFFLAGNPGRVKVDFNVLPRTPPRQTLLDSPSMEVPDEKKEPNHGEPGNENDAPKNDSHDDRIYR